jgi:hypothetical protein
MGMHGYSWVLTGTHSRVLTERVAVEHERRRRDERLQRHLACNAFEALTAVLTATHSGTHGYSQRYQRVLTAVLTGTHSGTHRACAVSAR